MNNNNNFFLQSARAKEQAKAEAERLKAEQDAIRVKNASGMARKEIKRDFDAGKELGQEILGEGLGRIQGDKDVAESKGLMRTRAQEGLTDREENAMREKGLNQIQGAEKKASRGMAASLARSGVRGGAAAAANLELAGQSMQNRRAFETDLILNDESVKRKAETDFANFSTKLAEFDLAQAAKEKNIMLQTQLATAQLGSTERGAVQNAIAQENAAKAQKRSCFPVGTMIEMADGELKSIQCINIGDETLRGGVVTAVHQFKNDEILYNLNGVLVTGAHAAFHNGLFSRVEHIEEAIPTTSKPKVVYSISTENHRMVIGGDLFADYAETDYDVNDEESLYLLNHLARRKKAV